MDKIELHWQGPFSFFPNEVDPYLFDHPLAACQGIYLWTVPTAAGMKVAYVGKAGGKGRKSTFGSRLGPELREAMTARYQQLLDLTLWKNGNRLVVKGYSAYDESQYQETLDAIRRACRVYLAVVEAYEPTLVSIEELLVRRLNEFHQADELPKGCVPFLSNRRRIRPVDNLAVSSRSCGILGLSGDTL